MTLVIILSLLLGALVVVAILVRGRARRESAAALHDEPGLAAALTAEARSGPIELGGVAGLGPGTALLARAIVRAQTKFRREHGRFALSLDELVSSDERVKRVLKRLGGLPDIEFEPSPDGQSFRVRQAQAPRPADRSD